MVLKNRKPLKLVVCMSLIVALAISALGISVWASFENTHNNSGNQASDIVGVAQTQVGYAEGYNGYTKYGDWYGLPNSDWCAMFVSWCANQAGVDNSVFPSFALCSAGCDWFIQQGRFHYSGSYAPQPGDLIFYSSYGNIYHVGLVTGSDGSNVYSIEGNYSDQVSNVSYSLGYGDILGYASPNYSLSGSTAVTVDTPDVDEDSDDEEIFESSDEEVFEDSDISEIETDSYIDTDTTDSEDDEKINSEVFEADSDSEIEYLETDTAVDSDTDSELVIIPDTESDVETVDSTDTDTASETEADVTTDVDSDTENDASVTTDVDSEVESDTDTSSEIEDDGIAMGDANGDGVIDSYDALLVQRYLLFGTSHNDIIIEIKADVNGSGSVDIGDAFMILQMSVHIL